MRQVSGDNIGVETTVGYLWSENGTSYTWYCHEAVTQTGALMTPRYTQNGSGVVLAMMGDLEQSRQTDETVYRTEDGCDWDAPTGLTGHQIADVQFDPMDDQVVLAVTANEDSANIILRSTDGGVSWSETGMEVEDRVFRTVMFSRGNAASVWATAVQYETREAWIYHSTDGGITWTENDVEITSPGSLDVYVDLVAVDGEDPDEAWIVIGPYFSDQLMHTTDAGVSFTEVYALSADIIDGAQDSDGGIWLVITGNEMLHAPVGDEFAAVESAPAAVGLEIGPEGILVATRVDTDGSVMAVSSDGDTFEHLFPMQSLTGPPVCAAESHSAIYCDPLWANLSAVIFASADTADTGKFDGTKGPDEEAKGCCAREQKSTSLFFFLAGLAPFFRRRNGMGSSTS